MTTVAVLGGDYVGLKPRMAVKAGEHVELGQKLFVDKRDPDVCYTAPGSGTVSAVNRGARRSLQSVVIDLDPDASAQRRVEDLVSADPASPDADAIRAVLFQTGLWTALRTRPYGRVPLSTSAPRSIFVTAIDTQPLAGNPAVIVAADSEAFQKGLDILARLTEGPVFLCTAPGWTGPAEGERLEHVEFSGPHPAGLVGTHIHHLDPVSADRTVWHIGYQDVIAVGKLFLERRIDVARIVSLGGAGFEQPRLVRTRVGASIDDLAAGQLVHDERTGRAPRLISGSVLNGTTAAGPVAYLGRYHQQVSAIPDGGERRLFGWLGRFSQAPTFAGILRRRRKRRKPLQISTALNGRPTAAVPVDIFEHVLPLDILPIPLLRALLVKDTDQAQALGCLELDPEDLALCSFVCPGKNDYGAVLSVNLEHIEREG